MLEGDKYCGKNCPGQGELGVARQAFLRRYFGKGDEGVKGTGIWG